MFSMLPVCVFRGHCTYCLHKYCDICDCVPHVSCVCLQGSVEPGHLRLADASSQGPCGLQVPNVRTHSTSVKANTSLKLKTNDKKICEILKTEVM